MRISDWSSDVCSSDLSGPHLFGRRAMGRIDKAAEGGKARPSGRQMDIFLDALAASSNVAASARAAGISGNAMYRERRRNPGFAARWHEALCEGFARRSEEHTSELQSLMRISYAVFCLKKQKLSGAMMYE